MSKSFGNKTGEGKGQDNRSRCSNRMLSRKGMAAAAHELAILNARTKRQGKEPPSGRLVVCGCGDLTCCFFSPDRPQGA